ncbi:hypothetical protein HMPREF9012_1785 [Bacteroidetes bacterium oral taxon 272 str. F0290]|nr:hypothetical protein HMPREF9012_1785 [Bacteroidetes bacterium oral taxon 272 str. F0290]
MRITVYSWDKIIKKIDADPPLSDIIPLKLAEEFSFEEFRSFRSSIQINLKNIRLRGIFLYNHLLLCIFVCVTK